MIESEEVWKPIPDILGLEADLHGDIRMLDCVMCDESGERFIKGGIRKQYKNNCDYWSVNVFMGGKWHMKLVHRLVAEAFIPNPDRLPEINHLDNDPMNNVPSNLEWCTHEYNVQYREKFGMSAKKAFGRPVIAINIKTQKTLLFETQLEASRSLGFSVGNIGDVLAGHGNKTHGYWFTRADENAVETVRAKFGDTVASKVEASMAQTATK